MPQHDCADQQPKKCDSNKYGCVPGKVARIHIVHGSEAVHPHHVKEDKLVIVISCAEAESRCARALCINGDTHKAGKNLCFAGAQDIRLFNRYPYLFRLIRPDIDTEPAKRQKTACSAEQQQCKCAHRDLFGRLSHTEVPSFRILGLCLC